MYRPPQESTVLAPTDFFFFFREKLLPADALIEQFQYATQIVLTLDNHKNTIRGETVSYFRSESSADCPVQAGIRTFLRMQQHRFLATTLVSNYPPAGQGLCSISASDIISVLRAETHQVGATRIGFAPEDAGAHSLCSGGVMSIQTTGSPDCTLMAISRWRSL